MKVFGEDTEDGKVDVNELARRTKRLWEEDGVLPPEEYETPNEVLLSLAVLAYEERLAYLLRGEDVPS
jgi:hypothetical protein